MNNPEGAQANRRVFLSPPLKGDVRLSGTAQLDLQASLSTDAVATSACSWSTTARRRSRWSRAAARAIREHDDPDVLGRDERRHAVQHRR